MSATSITRRRFLVGAGASLVVGCARSSPPSPHVVIVNIDQLRKDAADRWLVGVGELAGQGIAFDQMRSTAPWTYPSVLSLMTGLLPQQHAADGHRFKDRLANFAPELPTLQQTLQGAGYRTQAFVTNPFLHTWNAFHQGFDHFDAGFVQSQGNLRGFGKLVWDPARMFSNSVNEAIVRHFEARPVAAPEFSYVHYIDVHGPWDGAPFAASYEAAVRYLDQRVVELYQYFSDRYGGDMLFFVTSDHGRGWEADTARGYGAPWRKSKASLHDFNLRIPAAFLPSSQVSGPRRIADPCSNIDVVPTLLDWLDLSPPLELPGESLLPAIAGRKTPPKAVSGQYAKMSAFGRLSDCLVLGDRKYLRFFEPKTGQLVGQRVFDLANDPEETRSLGSDFGEAAPLLQAAAGTQGVEYAAHFSEPDAELLERLQALGYMR